jgi:predicted transglutaminase-like cysteine proteinase
VLVAAVAGVLQASALTAATPVVAATPLLASEIAIGAPAWTRDDALPWGPGLPSADHPWLGLPTLSLERGVGARTTDDWSYELSPATIRSATAMSAATPARGEGALGVEGGGQTPGRIVFAEPGAASPLASAPAAAPLDISMKPVADGAGTTAPRLQPAVYARPATGPAFPSPPASTPQLGGGDQPNIFGSIALAAGHTPEDAKWRRVETFVPSAGAGPWTPILAQARRQSGRARLEAVNAWVNHAISWTSDLANYGVADYWGTARESLARGRGDCKDYAITKMELLRALGVPTDDLYLVLVKDLVRRQDHAVLAVRLDGRFVILDSGVDGVMDSEEIRDYRPILTFSGDRTWVHGFRRSEDVMVASASTAPSAGFAAR